MTDVLKQLFGKLMNSYRRSHLRQLESEAIYIMREVAAQFERPVLLFSGGKDSIVMVHLAQKAFTLPVSRSHYYMSIQGTTS